MIPKKTMLVLVLIVSVVIVSVLAFNYLRSQQTSLTLEESIAITHYNLNRKTNTLLGVNLTSEAVSSIVLTSGKMVKVQSGIAVASNTFTPSLTLAPNSTIYVPLGYSLDPEGADYTIYILTSKGTGIKGTLAYP